MLHLVNSICAKIGLGRKAPKTLVLSVAKQWVTSTRDGGEATRCDMTQLKQCDVTRTPASKQKTRYFWPKCSLSSYMQTADLW